MNRNIAELVPHAGSMVLLDRIIFFNPETIHCQADLVPDQRHPLVVDGRLPATALAEYGAQAMAVHGGLLEAPDRLPRPGRLAGLSHLDLAVDALLDPVCLDVHVRCLSSERSGQIYQFEVLAEDRWLARGRATIMFADSGTEESASA